MTRSDAAKLMGIIVLAYPNYDRFKDEKQVKATVELWTSMFSEDDAGVVGLAIKKHIATSKWPPSVAELRELMLEMTAPDLIAPDQAWLAVSDFIKLHGEHSYGGEKTSLPPLVSRAVESIGYHNLYEMNCGSYRGSKPGMARTAFMNLYSQLYERERNRAMTPECVTQQIDKVAERLSTGERAKLENIHQRRMEKEQRDYEFWYSAIEGNLLTTAEEQLQLTGGDE